MFGFDNSKNDDTKSEVTDSAVPLSAPPIPSTQTDTPAAPVSSDEPSRTMPAVSTPSTKPTPDPADSEDLLPENRSKDDLSVIKQEALQKLSPLVEHLEQSPEEKFKTTMMMIQATDDHSLINTAFAAAKDIKDDKARAQALLDVVNEINYFTQQQS